MKKLIIALAGISALVLAALYGMVLYNGPRMKVQPHIRAFQTVLPTIPAGVVSVETPEKLPTAKQASGITNPLENSSANLERGRVYYHYYCVFCHGEQGNGNGPVGESYLPVPAVLHSSKIRQYSDGQLLRAMLIGTGHEPVLERIVAPRHRWYVVLFVRSFLPAKEAGRK